MKKKKDKNLDIMRVKGTKEVIEKPKKQPIILGSELKEKIRRELYKKRIAKTARSFMSQGKNDTAIKILNAGMKLGKKGLKALPIVGGFLGAAASQDASAAIPVLSEADALGPRPGSPESDIENPTISLKQRKKIRDKLLKRNK